jgi:hypothetical protein
MERSQEKVRIARGLDEYVLVGDLGRFGAARVDHDHLAAAPANLGEAPLHVGSRHHAAIRHDRVGADDQQIVSAIEVRHRHQHRATEHFFRSEHVWGLISRRSRVQVLGSERAQHTLPDRQQAQVVRDGVALIHRHRIATMGRAHGGETMRGARERLFPGRLSEDAAVLHHRRAQAIRVVAQRAHADDLGADEAPALRVVGVTTHAQHVATFDLYEDPAGRLAQDARRDFRLRHW